MTTEEKNIVIAKFMAAKIEPPHYFHSSWDWLMPVIEKIAKLEIEKEEIIHNGVDSFFDTHYPRTFAMVNAETKEFMVRINRFGLHQSQSLIEATHEAVVEFILFIERGQEKI